MEDKSIDFFNHENIPCRGTGVVKLDPHFKEKAKTLINSTSKKLYPNSVCRTPEHNRNVGGHPRSLHLTDNPVHPTAGCAAMDIAWRSWPEQEKLEFAKHCWSLGWSVGLHDGFIHLDSRTESAGLPQAKFLYGTWTGTFKVSDL